MSKIEGRPDLERDDSNNAIINRDTSSFLQARAVKELSLIHI